MLTAFTTHVTTDIASAPLLWVLPLSLYLLTFVLVFRDKPLIPRQLLLLLHLVAVAVALLVLSQTKHDSWFVTATTGVAVFFTSAMVAHRTLYEARPAARFLTEFYLWMSLGGALGGLAAALIAPRIFSEVFEYPLLLALSMACRPGVLQRRRAAPRVGQHEGRAGALHAGQGRARHAGDDGAGQAGIAGAVADRGRRHPRSSTGCPGRSGSCRSISANGAPRRWWRPC